MGFPTAEFAVDGRKWNTNNLTYAIVNTPVLTGAVQTAMKMLFPGRVTPLRFTGTGRDGYDIDILLPPEIAATVFHDGPERAGRILPTTKITAATRCHFDTETWTM